MKNKILPIFIPNLGCKNKCVFCNQRAITSTKEKVITEITQKISKCNKNDSIDEVAFFGGSFTCLPIDFQKKILDSVNHFVKSKNAVIRLSTYPDCITEENLLLLKKYNVKVIELGVQSLDKQVLEKSGRFYDPEVVYKSAELIKKYKFLLGLQIMLGLPGSSKQNEFKTLEGVIRINPKYLRIYPMVVIKHTKLEEMYYKKTYQPLKVDEITDRISDMFEMLENTNIKVIRIGLHSEQDFVENCIIDTGSYHNSLGQMVKSRYIHKKILKFQKKCCKNSEIIVKYNAYSVSLLYGHKNIYKDAYNKAGFILKSDSRISKKHFIISNGLIKENIFI